MSTRVRLRDEVWRVESKTQAAGRTLYQRVPQPSQQGGVVCRHVHQAHPWIAEVIPHPGSDKGQLNHGKAAKTQPDEVGDLTISMLRGEEGNQSRELDELIGWLKQHPHPDVICLSNALLAGMVRALKQELRSPVVCMLQGEDYFLDSLPQTQRELAWKTLAERAAEVDLFIAPSRYFADLMGKRLNLPPDRVRVVFNGINLEGYRTVEPTPDPSLEGSRRSSAPGQFPSTEGLGVGKVSRCTRLPGGLAKGVRLVDTKSSNLKRIGSCQFFPKTGSSRGCDG